MKKIVLLVAVALSLYGCATKQYAQSPSVSSAEAAALDCKAISQELAKCHSTQEEIERTGDFDGKTVLGFLGDFGVGNAMAKDTAREA
jgi:outer membrane lipoprotein SlyB